MPRPNSAVNRLLRALNKLLDYEPSVQLTPSVEQAFRAFFVAIDALFARLIEDAPVEYRPLLQHARRKEVLTLVEASLTQMSDVHAR